MTLSAMKLGVIKARANSWWCVSPAGEKCGLLQFGYGYRWMLPTARCSNHGSLKYWIGRGYVCRLYYVLISIGDPREWVLIGQRGKGSVQEGTLVFVLFNNRASV